MPLLLPDGWFQAVLDADFTVRDAIGIRSLFSSVQALVALAPREETFDAKTLFARDHSLATLKPILRQTVALAKSLTNITAALDNPDAPLDVFLPEIAGALEASIILLRELPEIGNSADARARWLEATQRLDDYAQLVHKPALPSQGGQLYVDRTGAIQFAQPSQLPMQMITVSPTTSAASRNASTVVTGPNARARTRPQQEEANQQAQALRAIAAATFEERLASLEQRAAQGDENVRRLRAELDAIDPAEPRFLVTRVVGRLSLWLIRYITRYVVGVVGGAITLLQFTPGTQETLVNVLQPLIGVQYQVFEEAPWLQQLLFGVTFGPQLTFQRSLIASVISRTWARFTHDALSGGGLSTLWTWATSWWSAPVEGAALASQLSLSTIAIAAVVVFILYAAAAEAIAPSPSARGRRQSAGVL